MGLFDQLSEKYGYYLSSKLFIYEVALVCPGINPGLWMSLYANLSRNQTSFVIIFIGHVRPNFTLPENMIYIFSEMGPAPCGDIGYQFIFDHNLAQYTLWLADDQHFDNSFLDDLILNYKKHKLNYPNRVVGMSPVSRARDHANGKINGPDCMGWPNDGKWGKHGVTICANLFMSIEDSKLLGGADKRFLGLDSHIDRGLRVYSHCGGVLLILSEADCKPTQELPGHSVMSARTGRADRALLRGLYQYTRLDSSTGDWLLGCYDVARDSESYGDLKSGEIFWTEKHGGHYGENYFSKQRWEIKRTSALEPYTRDDLIFEKPDLSHTRIK